MKKYIFGLGAMLVGAGLMFVLMHGEVSAEVEMLMGKGKEKEIHCEQFRAPVSFLDRHYNYCKIKDLICVAHTKGISCVKS